MKRSLINRIAFVCFVIMCFSLTGQIYAQEQSKPIISLERIELPTEGNVEHYLISPDGRRYAYTTKKDDKWIVVVDGTIHGPYEEVLGSGRKFWSFSQDSKHFAVGIRNGWNFHLVVDGNMSKPFDEIEPFRLDYSPSNESFACQASRNKKWGWYVHRVNGSPVYFAPTDSRPAERGQFNGSLARYRSQLQWNPEAIARDTTSRVPYLEGKEYLYLSLDHQHTVLFVSQPRKEKNSWPCTSVVIDGKAYDSPGEIRNFVASQTGGHHAWVCIERLNTRPRITKWHLVRDGQIVKTIQGIGDSNPDLFLSPDGSALALRYEHPELTSQSQGPATYLEVDGRRFGPYYGVYSRKSFSFSNDSRHHYFVVVSDKGGFLPRQPGRPPEKKPAQITVFHDGREIGSYLSVGPVVMSPDGTRIAFQAVLHSNTSSTPQAFKTSYNSWSTVVVDGVPGATYEQVGQPVFSNDSKHVAYTAHRNGKDLMVIGGREGPPESKILSAYNTSMTGLNKPLFFSPDGNDLWYFAKRLDGKIHAVKNGQSVFIGGGDKVYFTPDGKHLITLVRSSTVYMNGVRIDWQQEGKSVFDSSLGLPFLSLPFSTLSYLDPDSEPFFIFKEDYVKEGYRRVKHHFLYKAKMTFGSALASTTNKQTSEQIKAQEPDIKKPQASESSQEKTKAIEQIEILPVTSKSSSKTEDTKSVTSNSNNETSQHKIDIPSELDTPEFRKALSQLSPELQQDIISKLNDDSLKRMPSAMRSTIVTQLVQSMKYMATYQSNYKNKKESASEINSQEPPFEHLDPKLASNVIDYGKPAAFSATHYFETLRWWTGTFNFSHKVKTTGNVLFVQEEAKKQLKSFVGKPIAWIMEVNSVSTRNIVFNRYEIPQNERNNKNLYPNGTSGSLSVDNGRSGTGNNLRIGAEISKEQAMSLRKGSHVIVQARLKDYKVNKSGYLRISLDKVKLIPIKYSRINSIAP